MEGFPPELRSIPLLHGPLPRRLHSLLQSGHQWPGELVPLQTVQEEIHRDIFQELDLVSSRGGLLCFATVFESEFLVCNPVTRCYSWAGGGRVERPIIDARDVADIKIFKPSLASPSKLDNMFILPE